MTGIAKTQVKSSCVRWFYYITYYIHSSRKWKKPNAIWSNYSGTRVLSTEIKITQFPNGFRLNCCKLIVSRVKIYCSHHWFTREMKYGWGHLAVKPVSSRNVGCFLGLNLQQNMLFSNPFHRDIVTHLTVELLDADQYWE